MNNNVTFFNFERVIDKGENMIRFCLSKLFKKIFRMSAVRHSQINKTAKIGDGCNISSSSLGAYSYVGDHSNITKARIGKFTSISSYCFIGGGAHPTNWVSMSPVFTDTRCIVKEKYAKKEFNPYQETVIGNDVWIGVNALIKSGVHISDGAVIGMGSVVTKDIGPYEIWAGNPAKLIRKRFDDETIQELLKTEWWNWDKKKLIAYADLFDSPYEFIDKID